MSVWTVEYIDGYYPNTVQSIHKTELGAKTFMSRLVDNDMDQHSRMVAQGIYNHEKLRADAESNYEVIEWELKL